MSLSQGGSGLIEVLAPVSTVAQAAESAAAGARLVDVGQAGELIPAIRRAVSGVRICGYDQACDIVHDAGLAARTGAGLICTDLPAATRAAGSGIPVGRILVRTAPAGLESCSRSGWACLVDLDEQRGSLPREEAVAAVCTWLGARVIRTRHVTEIRRCIDMTESILGRRPPAWAIRGLA